MENKLSYLFYALTLSKNQISFNYSTGKALKLTFKVYTFSHRADYEFFSKINFTTFLMELRNKFLGVDEAYNDISFGHLVVYYKLEVDF